MEARPARPPVVRDAIERLRAAGIPVWIVGGAVRDALLGRPIRDFDLVAEADREAIARALPGAVAIDARAPVLLLEAPGVRVEVSPLREGAHDLASDLALRDFTFNAIALDPAGERWIDPLDGRADLEARRLRAADPARALRDDPLRVLRGARYELELGLEIAPDTLRAMERNAWRLTRAPGERLREELFRTLALPVPSPALERLRRTGALAPLLPELLRGVGVEQNRAHRDDLYRHTLCVCDLSPARPLVRLAALLHDAAKPETKRWLARTGDFAFHRHDLEAARHVRRVAERLRLSRRDASRVERLVRHHLLFPEALETPRALRRMLARVRRDILDDLLALREADYASRTPDRRPPAAWTGLVERIRGLEGGVATQAPLAISGRDVMRALDLPEGREVGRWLARARRRALECPEENDRERLLAWLCESRRSESEREET